MLLGNDISVFQGDVNYDVYKNNSNFVIVKASEGVGFTDPKFSRNQTEARRVGMPVGYYHFARPDLGNDPAHEADWFLNVIGQPKDGEMYCLDFEVTYHDAVNWCKLFLDRVKFMCNGYQPLIYLNQSQCTTLDWSPVVNAGYGLWIAAYTYDPNNNNFNIGAWPFAAIQQWTNSQTVPGINGNIDGDVLFGNESTFRAYSYHAPVPTSTSTSTTTTTVTTTTLPPVTSTTTTLPPVTTTTTVPFPDTPDTKYILALLKIKAIAMGGWFTYLRGRSTIRTILSDVGL